ncbi:hypothetical protein E8P82_05040 [Arthrobacter echini]|uniref:Uncharacterized protein n=1 Tax=Arthrobacter echini TaxID=1529066 RepID=A0A4S5E7K7_9MICC|nr:hypothetical protein [Arthrobacter echini]THJ67463.1 hypothetical protein E8P82_05040 [Arthrobacter echini]
MTSISDLWSALDADVRQWLLANPGARMLPRTYVNHVPAGGTETGQCLRLDEHGDYWLTADEIAFLTARRAEGLEHRPSTEGANTSPEDPVRPEGSHRR